MNDELTAMAKALAALARERGFETALVMAAQLIRDNKATPGAVLRLHLEPPNRADEGMTPVSLAAQIQCVLREIGLRHRVYPKWIEAKRMTQAQAEREIARMESVLETLQAMQRDHEPALL